MEPSESTNEALPGSSLRLHLLAGDQAAGPTAIRPQAGVVTCCNQVGISIIRNVIRVFHGIPSVSIIVYNRFD